MQLESKGQSSSDAPMTPGRQLTQDKPHDAQQLGVGNARLYLLRHDPRDTEEGDDARSKDAQERDDGPLIREVADDLNLKRVVGVQRRRARRAIQPEGGLDGLHLYGSDFEKLSLDEVGVGATRREKD